MATDGHCANLETSIPDVNSQHRRVKKGTCHVNTQLLPVKGFYFMIHTVLAIVQPYIVIYMKQQGLSASESGVLFGFMPFLSFLVQPLVGAAADRWLKHKAVLVTATVLTGLFHLLFLAVPPRPPAGNVLTTSANVTCTNLSVPILSMCVDGERESFVSSACLESNDDFVNISRNGSQTLDCLSKHERTPCFKDAVDLFQAVSSGTSGSSLTADCVLECKELRSNESSVTVEICTHDDKGQNGTSACAQTKEITFPLNFRLGGVSEAPVFYATGGEMNRQDSKCQNLILTSVLAQDGLFSGAMCLEESTSPCKISCELASGSDHSCAVRESAYDVTFWAIFMIFLVGYLLQGPITPMADAASYGILKDKRELFGRQRLFGSLGYLVASGSLSLGVYLMNKDNQELDFTILFSAHAGLCAISALIGWFIHIPMDVRCGNILKKTWKLFGIPRVTCFLLVVFYFGFMMGSIISFLFWYLLDLGAPAYIFGLARVCCVTSEIPIFTFSGRLVKRFGPVTILCVAMVTMSIRLAVYSVLQNPWLVLLVEPLHGVTFCLMITAATTYASVISPPGMAATTQGMVGGMLWGLGRGAGALVTGWMFSELGARYTYGIYAGCGIVVLAAYSLLNRLVFKEQPPPSVRTEMTIAKRGEGEPTDTETRQPLVHSTQTNATPAAHLDNGSVVQDRSTDQTHV